MGCGSKCFYINERPYLKRAAAPLIYLNPIAMNRLRFVVATLAFAAVASPAFAQSTTETRSGLARMNLISANPIGLLFEWYNAEFEHALKSTVSLAVAASSYDLDNTRYASVDGIARYYPSARALKGFSIGASVGFIDLDDHYDYSNCIGCGNDSGTSATIGVRGDYVWILGRDQRFAVGAGIGAKRILNDALGTEGVPIGRLSIGYAW
jgi:hypothetical protein